MRLFPGVPHQNLWGNYGACDIAHHKGRFRMKTYYITNSTIFSKEEDVVKALMSGETIVNDDADLRFSIEKRYGKDRLFIRDKFIYCAPDNWYYLDIDLNNPKKIVDAMDNAVAKIIGF